VGRASAKSFGVSEAMPAMRAPGAVAAKRSLVWLIEKTVTNEDDRCLEHRSRDPHGQRFAVTAESRVLEEAHGSDACAAGGGERLGDRSLWLVAHDERPVALVHAETIDGGEHDQGDTDELLETGKLGENDDPNHGRGRRQQ
jgi:hypothetical protein